MMPYGYLPTETEEDRTYSDSYLRLNYVECSDCGRVDGYHNAGCKFDVNYELDEDERDVPT